MFNKWCLLLSLALLAPIVWMTDWSLMGAVLGGPGAIPALMGTLAFAAALLARGLRFHLAIPAITGGQITPGQALRLAFINNFGNQVLPLRLGEAAFLAGGVYTTSFRSEQGLAVLMLVRVYDILSLILIVVVALIASSIPVPAWTMWLLCVVAAACLAAALCVDRFLHGSLWALNRLVDLFGLSRRKFVQAVLLRLSRLDKTFPACRSPAFVLGMLSMSVAVWLGVFGCFALFLSAFGIHFSFPDAIIASSGAVGVALLPISALGTLGSLEWGWIAGVTAFGESQRAAAASGIAMHSAVILVSGIATFAFGWPLFITVMDRLKERRGVG